MNKALHILHADDDGEDRWIFQDGLSEYDPGIRLTQFDDGIHLLKHIETMHQDLNTLYAIICDMQMPKVSGLEVLSKIKLLQAWKAVPFIIFSTSSLTEDIRRCMNNGALAFYTKPNTFPENGRVISEMVLCCKQNAYAEISLPTYK